MPSLCKERLHGGYKKDTVQQDSYQAAEKQKAKLTFNIQF